VDKQAIWQGFSSYLLRTIFGSSSKISPLDPKKTRIKYEEDHRKDLINPISEWLIKKERIIAYSLGLCPTNHYYLFPNPANPKIL
jgi:hypothetical protein